MASIPSQQRDYKMDGCRDYANESFKTRTPKTPGLQLVEKVFRHNVARVRYMMVLPAMIGHAAIEIERIRAVAEFEVTNALGNTLTDETKTEIMERWKQLYEMQKAEDSKLIGTPAWDKLVSEAHAIGSLPVNMLSRASEGTLGFDAILSTYIVSAWTAFETMSGDLWESALNINPNALALLRGRPRRQAEILDPSSSRGRHEEIPKSIDLDLIKFHSFDLREKMGTILRGRYEFSRLTKIREAYLVAFDKDAGQIEAAITHQSLDALSAVRNLIVHRAAIIDAEYLRRSERLTIPKGEKGRPIALDGEIVVGIIKPALIAAAKIIDAVDTWLEKHKN